MSLYKKIFSAIFLRGVGDLLTFLVLLYISRRFGTEGSGVFAIFLLIQTLGVSLSNLGYNDVLVKYLSWAYEHKDEHQLRLILNTVRSKVLRSVAIVTFIAFACIWVLIKLKINSIEPFFLLAVLLIPLNQAVEQNSAILRSIGKYQYSWVFVGVVTPIIALLLFLIIGVSSVVTALLIYILATSITAITSFLIVNKYMPAAFPIRLVSYNALENMSKPLYTIGIVTMLAELDVFFVSIWLNLADTGIYNTAKKISVLPIMMLVAVNSVVSPQIAMYLKKQDYRQLQHMLRNVLLLLLVYATIVSLTVIIFPKEILGVFGKEFTHGAVALVIMVCGQFINIATGPVGQLLIMGGFEKQMRNNVMYVSLISFLLYIIFIPIYGVLAAASITAIRTIMQNVIAFILVKRYIPHVFKLASYQS